MSSKKLAYLFMVSIVCGFVVAGTAHGQSNSIFNIEGTIENSDGMPAAGLAVKGERISLTDADPEQTITGDDGSYKLLFIGLPIPLPGFAPEISVGEQIEITVSDGGVVVHSETVTVTVAHIESAFAGTTVNITLTDFDVEAAPDELLADGTSTSEITVTVGAGVTETPTISVDKGTIGAVTPQGNGVYTVTYTAPSLVITFPPVDIARITATLASTGQSTDTVITLLPVPTTVTVDIDTKEFSADTPGTGTVTVTVDRAGPITGESIAFTLNPSVGSGTVSAATDNGDGTYTATYASGSTAGYVDITATATGANESGSVRIAINAGPPANIAVSTDSETVSSFASATITAMVTDSNGNGVGGQSLTRDALSGTLTEFAADPSNFGTYTATYTAPMVDAEGTETITVTAVAGISDMLTFNLTPEPPIEVNVLTVQGKVFKVDGEVPADGVNVEITLGSMTKTTTTDADGSFSETFVGFDTPVARTGYAVTIVVTDAAGTEVGGDMVRLTNDLLDGAPVEVNITTNIVIPPRSVNFLTVEGTVTKVGGQTSAGSSLDVTVTVGGSRTGTDTTDEGGSYSVTFAGFGETVATSGDSLSVVVSDGARERGRNDMAIRNIDLPEDGDAATIERKVETNISITSPLLIVAGTVYLKNGDQLVEARNDLREDDLTVVVTNTTRKKDRTESVTDDGKYSVTFFELGATVAETGDELTVEVRNEAGEPVGSMAHTLTPGNLETAEAEVNVKTTVPAEVRILHIVGDVIDVDDSPAAPGLPVTIRIIDMYDNIKEEVQILTEADGSYEHLFINLETPVAATGDVLTVDVLRASDQFRGHAREPLSSYKLVYQNQPLEILPPIKLVPPRLELGGLSINPHYTGIQDPIIQNFLGMDLAGLAAAGASAVDPSGNLLVSLPPSPFLLLSPILAAIGAYQLELPAGFDPTNEHIAQESFGNAITTRPTAWAAFSADARHPGRWVNGDQLNLYISGAPTIESVTFMLNGTPMSATPVPAGGSFMYNFQLEEEWIALFSGSMPAFKAVQLMIDEQMPINMTPGDAGVWSADVALSPGDHVSYYYMVELSKPYVDPMGGIMITKLPFLDPRNRQVRTDGLSQTIENLTTLERGGISEGLRSVFSVPEVNQQQSLWVGTLPLDADGPYQLDVNVSYRGGHTDSIDGQMIYVDQTAPTADVTLSLDAPGSNASLYMRDDGTYVATGPMPGEASLTVSIPGATSNEPDGAGYMFQLALLDESGYPGTWNPVITADLLPLNLEKLLNNPAGVLPLTLGSPIDMLIRNSAGGALYGRYGLRAVGIDSLLNMDSGRGPGVVVDLVPPDPDVAMVSSVTADFDGNGAIAGLETQSTAGDVVVFSDSIVTLAVDVVERTAHPLVSIAIEVEMPGVGSQPVAMFSGDQLAATMLGDQFMVTLPVPDIPGLPDRGSHAILRTVTTNALNVVNTQEVSVAYQRRTPPEVSAIHTYVTDRHPDSGGVQGMITVSAFTQAMTLPDAAAVQLEIRRSADADWAPLGIVQIAGTTVISIDEEVAIIRDRINAILSGAPTASISPIYRKWSLPVDSATLEDTITDDSPAASDASLDDNPYVLRAIAVDTAGTGYPSADGVTDSLSLDNYSPTAITQVANEVEMVAAREDGSYYVSGLIAEDVLDPMLTLTSRTGAHPSAFTGGLKLAINDAAGAAVAIDETVFNAAGNHTHTAAFNLASIPNGMYTFMAVAHAADGATEERIVAMAIAVEVGNFTPPDNFADPTVDILSVTNTRGQANSPSDTDAQYPIGLPAVGDEACATLIVPNVSAGDVDVLIGEDLMSAAMMGALTVMDPDANNNILVCIDTSGLDEGMLSLVGTVTKPNGSVQFGLPSIRVDRTAPVIEIVSPLEGHQVSTRPTVQVAYTDDTGFDPEKTNPMPVEITLTRLASDKTVDINTSMIRMIGVTGEVLSQTGNIVYTHDDQLAGGAYRIDATVTDALGNTSTAEPVEFTSEGVQPNVTIITPSAGQVVDPDQALIISAAFTGIGEITVDQLLINGGTYKPQSVKGNLLTHTIQPPFGVLFKRGSGNRISIKIVDEEGNTAEATTNFAVAKDTIPPVVATYSPLGIIRTDRPIAAATVTDASGIKTSSLTIIIAGVPGNQGTGRRSSKTSTTVTFTPSIAVTPGPYTARVTVEDVHGNRTEAEWQFTVELDVTPPSITTSSPHGVIRSDKPIISVSASDDMSGVDTIEIGVKGEGNQTVAGVTSVRSDKTSATFTPAASLTSGTYTVDVKLADMRGNKASGQWQFTVELDTIPPSITITRPMQEHTENRRPTVSASYTDNLSGVDAESITLSLDGAAIEPDAVSETQVMFTPQFDLTFGQHTVKLEVSDMAPSANTAVQEWSFFVERMGIANARNYPNPFDGDTTIALRISRQASITVQIYDFTGRLVAEPISNSVREAGPVEIEWDGQTSAGDNLARGVYFCHILMESELEPQSAILKMAIISD